MYQYQDLEYQILNLIRQNSITQTLGGMMGNRLVFGGEPGPSGGTGGGWTTPVGQLPQTNVCFDTSESNSGDIPASGSSLLDNLNRIRAGVTIVPSGVLPSNYSVVEPANLVDHLKAIDAGLASAAGWPFSNVITVDPTDPDADYSDPAVALAAASSGDVVLLGPNNYSISPGLTVPDGVTLMGYGDATILTVASASNTAFLILGDAANLASIKLVFSTKPNPAIRVGDGCILTNVTAALTVTDYPSSAILSVTDGKTGANTQVVNCDLRLTLTDGSYAGGLVLGDGSIIKNTYIYTNADAGGPGMYGLAITGNVYMLASTIEHSRAVGSRSESSGQHMYCMGARFTGSIQYSKVTMHGTFVDSNGRVSLGNTNTVNSVTTDTGLAGNSDLNLPTEKAVKAYVDSQVHSPVTLGGGSDAALTISGQQLTLADVLTPSEHTAIGDGAPHHAAVTLGASNESYLSLAGQALTFQVGNTLTIGDGAAGDKTLAFNAVSDATIAWDGTEFQFGSKRLCGVADPTDADDAVNLHYLQDHTSVTLEYFMHGSSGMSTTLVDSETHDEELLDATPTDTMTLCYKSSAADTPAPFKITSGAMILFHFNAKVTATAGKKPVTLQMRLFYVDADGTSNKTAICDISDASAELTTTKTYYELHGHTAADVDVPAGKRLWLELYANTTGASGYPTVWIYRDKADNHISFGVTGSIFGNYMTSAAHTAIGNSSPHHAQQHAIASSEDHTSVIGSGYLFQANSLGLPVAASNTNTQVAATVTASHAKQHAITATADHTSGATAGRMLKADANGLPVDATNTDTAVAAAVAASHAAVTLDANVDNVLALTTQQLNFVKQTANRVFAGPTSGASTVEPTFRTLVAADIPELALDAVKVSKLVGATDSTPDPSLSADTSGNLTAVGSLTITPMSTAGYVKNSAAGLLSGGNTIAAADLPAHDHTAAAKGGDYAWADITGFATSSVALGSAAAEGNATTVLRSNCTIVAFDATNPTTQAMGDAAAVGSAAYAARRDHKHAMPSFSATTPVAVSTAAGAVGSSASPARSDHQHTLSLGASVTVSGSESGTKDVVLTDSTSNEKWFLSHRLHSEGNTLYCTYFDGSASYTTALVLGILGGVAFPSIGTTSSAGNAFLDSGSSNSIKRSTSSRRYKENICPLDDHFNSSLVYNLEPKAYNSAIEGDVQAGQWLFGLIAEEVEQVYPSLVTRDQYGRPDWVQYPMLPVLLLAEMKKMRAALEAHGITY